MKISLDTSWLLNHYVFYFTASAWPASLSTILRISQVINCLAPLGILKRLQNFVSFIQIIREYIFYRNIYSGNIFLLGSKLCKQPFCRFKVMKNLKPEEMEVMKLAGF